MTSASLAIPWECLLNHQARITEAEAWLTPYMVPAVPRNPIRGPLGGLSLSPLPAWSAITPRLLNQSRSLLTGLPGPTLAPRTTLSPPSSQGTLSKSQTALPDFPSCSEKIPTPPPQNLGLRPQPQLVLSLTFLCLVYLSWTRELVSVHTLPEPVEEGLLSQG